MSKFFQALLSGIFFTFILDFFLFLGIKLNYLEHYGIKEYYNTLFADHQNLLIFALVTVVVGVVVVYVENLFVKTVVMGVLFLGVLATLTPPVGFEVGKRLLQKENVRYNDGKFLYFGTLYYEGRDTITLYDDELKRVITLQKKDLQQ